MKYGVLKRFIKLRDFFKQKIDRKVIIFLFFFLISSFFWLLNSLSKEYTSDFGFPIRYSNFPKNKVLVGDLPAKLDISIKAYGFTLLKYKIKPTLPPIPIDLRSITFNPNSNRENKIPNYYILTRYELDRIDKQLSNEIEVVGISPDTIYFQFVNVISKKVPVQANIDINFEKQYMQNGDINLIPDSILITGPRIIIDTISRVVTDNKIFTEVNDTINQNIDISSIDNVKTSEKEVKLLVPVEKYTELNLEIPIQIINLPDSLFMTIFPKKVKLTFLVGLSKFNNIKEYLFRAEIDYLKIDESLSKKMKIELVKSPEFVREIKHYPLNVDYIIEK